MIALLRRRQMMQDSTASEKTTYIRSTESSAVSANILETPIIMPSNAIIVIDCSFIIEDLPTDGRISDFTRNQSSVVKASSERRLSYHTHGNDWTCTLIVPYSVAVKKIELNRPNSYMYVTLETGEVLTSTQPRTWQNVTTLFRLFLSSYCGISKVTQRNSGTIVHELIPTEVGGAVGMIDTVTGLFYQDTTGNAYLTEE